MKKSSNGIKEERLKALKGNYIKPELENIEFTDHKIEGDCSDMASYAWCCAAAEIIRTDSLPIEHAFLQ